MKIRLIFITLLLPMLSSVFALKTAYATEIYKTDDKSFDVSGRMALMSQSGKSDASINDLGSRLQLSFTSYEIKDVTVKAVTLWGIGTQDKHTKEKSFLTNRESYIEASNKVYGKVKIGKFTNVISDNVLLKTDKTYVAKIDSGLTNTMPDGEGSDFTQWRIRKAVAYENNIGIVKFGLQGQGKQEDITRDKSLGAYINVDNKIFSIAYGYNKSNFDLYDSTQHMVGSSLSLGNFYIGLSASQFDNLLEIEESNTKSYSFYTSYNLNQFKPYLAYEEVRNKSKEYVWGVQYVPSKSLWLIYEASKLNNLKLETNNYIHSFVVRYNI